ncbi:zinc-binding dehydrogenase [Rhizobium lusitanum]|uniref:NADPH:quinone reductase n=1 Tax=Rhizobium lusitanum TaxID=293958 RepID=A0A1C3WDA9_9HYPH|nr:zinc-binding dehydrogenase [Rhizobium lusitanum]SCB37836.1 NADPH:quinone reductase [Rhizobium lusitanum]
MRAVVVKNFGGPEGLSIISCPDPMPAEGQVVIAVEAVGVGSVDKMIRSGALAAFGFREGFIPGSEVAGKISAAGVGVDVSWIGKRVWAFTGSGGGYAEKVRMPVEDIVILPSNLSPVDSVTLGSSGIVAHFAIRHAHFVPGESLLVRGAAGGIGVMAVQLAVRAGAGIIAVTASSPERGDCLRKLGASIVLDRTGDGRGSPSGYDVIIDIVGGPELASYFSRLNSNGRMVAVGAIAGFPPADFAAGMYAAFQKSLSFATFSAHTVEPAARRAVVAELFAAASRKELKAVVAEVFALDQVIPAHRKMETGDVFGRLALIP